MDVMFSPRINCWLWLNTSAQGLCYTSKHDNSLRWQCLLENLHQIFDGSFGQSHGRVSFKSLDHTFDDTSLKLHVFHLSFHKLTHTAV